MRTLPLLGLLGLGFASSAAAQSIRVPFPLDPSGTEDTLAALVVTPDLAAIADLDSLQAVTLVGMPLPGGTAVDLELRRIDLQRRKFGFQVDGRPAGDLISGLDLSVWKGSVAGVPGSDVMLSFSGHGSRGWVRIGSDLVHLMPRPDAAGDWSQGDALLTTEASLNAAGNLFVNDCAALPPAVPPVPSALQQEAGGELLQSFQSQIDSCSLRECPIAMETDWQFYQIFNDLNAATSYLTTLLSFVSDRYELQASTVLTFPYLQIYTTSNDPWTTPDTGGSSIDMLNEFRNAWQGSVPAGATLGHMMSGAGLGGGVAYLDVLCSTSANFGVSGNIAGQVNFPVMQQPNNWDFMVVAHELGHNFSSPHTHDFCPPLDECPPSQYFGSCQTQQTCTSMGTIMSYCHLCPGGTGNITTYFHPEAAALMTEASEDCNDALYEVMVDHPSYLSSTGTTPTTLQVVAGPVSGNVTVSYRMGGTGAFTTLTMQDQGSGLYLADLPAGTCGDSIEMYYAFDVTGLGTFTCPGDAPNELYTAEVGDLVAVFADDFEADQGWVATNQGATSGDWQRGVPVDDSGWDYDPAADYDGSGSAYLTENQLGNTDVDNGDVTLTSPALDLSDPATLVSYAYFLRLTNSDGDDRLLVEANSGGAWIEIARHDTDGGLSWRTNTISYDDMVAAGLTPSASTQLRFNANDAGDQSIVEAGLDALNVSTLNCGGGGFGTNYCGPAVANSTGLPGIISGSGSLDVGDNDVTLFADQLPLNQFGMFITSPNQGFVATANGNLCLAAPFGRYNAAAGYGLINTGASGSISLALDLSNHPTPGGSIAVLAGETHHFQAWYRDFVGGAGASNFTDGLTLIFQ